jgi:hypothetical protein
MHRIVELIMDNNLGLMVTVRTCWTSYQGSRDDLISEGICTEDSFPEGRKRLKDYYSPDNPSNNWSVRKLKGNLFLFTQYHGRKQQPPERGTEYRSLVEWQTHQDDFIDTLVKIIDLAITGESEKRTYCETTICFDKKTRDRVKAALHEIESAIRVGEAVWTGNARLTMKNLPVAKQDKDFQQFIKKIQLT